MNTGNSSITNIALVGGGTYCKEVIEKTSQGYVDNQIRSHIVAVADPDPETPGMVLARKRGLKTETDYTVLYRPENHIDLIIILTPDRSVLEDVLGTRPETIRVMAYHTFELFWKAIRVQERGLRRRKEELETILNGIQDLIVVFTPDREIVDANESFMAKMGFTREELLGKKCVEVYRRGGPPCLVGDLACPLNTVVREKRPSIRVLNRLNRKGEQRYFEVAIYPIWEEDGRISKFIEISRDITERKKEEEEITRRLEQMVEERTRQLKETHAKLIQQDKMASLGKLSASVVHEINNPNAGILNLTMLMKRIIHEGPMQGRDIEAFKRYLDLIESETKRISRIVSNLLSFSRQSKMEMKPLSLNRLVEKVLLLNSNLLKLNDIVVEKELDPALPDVNGSEDQLQQVCMNCVSNAVEAMEGFNGGTLTIATVYLPENDRVRLVFSDTGVGIDEESKLNLFEPFYTTKKKGKGVGLGLSVAYGIIEEHKGSISVVSQPGQGAVFSIELPVQ
ncbi:MAG: PAS domain-containing protein [Deltaproteobacteria bacterium]|nr:PAS domain-containing protein [Deltaproteobacteria bacterium]